MVPTDVLLDAMATLLAADTGTIAHAVNAPKVHLLSAAFVPSRSTDFTTLTEATFTGATALSAGTGTQQEFIDPTNLERVIQLKEPAGGWHWETGDAVGLPQTIYGWCCTDSASTVTFGSDLFPVPIVLTAANQGVDIAEVRFNVPGSFVP